MLPVLLLGHILVCYLIRFILIRCIASPEDAEDEHFVDKIEELEDDAGGMMLAFLCTITLRYMISGHYASYEAGEKSKLPRHSPLQRGVLLGYALMMCLAA